MLIAGFTPDVKIWEVEFSKGGDFQQVSRAMELMGHSAAVLSLSFSGDSQRWVCECGASGDSVCVCIHVSYIGWPQYQRMVHGNSGTQMVRNLFASSDKTNYLHLCSVRYRLSEDPKLLTTGKIPELGTMTTVALAPDSRVVAVAVDSSLFLFSSSSGDIMETLVDIHGGIQQTRTHKAVIHTQTALTVRLFMCSKVGENLELKFMREKLKMHPSW